MNEVEVVLDTNVVSYLMKGGRLAETYAPYVQGRLLAITFITVGEFYFGAEKANWGERRRQALETTLRNFVVIPYDHEIARSYGRLVAKRQGDCPQRCVDRSVRRPTWSPFNHAQRERLRRGNGVAGPYRIRRIRVFHGNYILEDPTRSLFP